MSDERLNRLAVFVGGGATMFVALLSLGFVSANVERQTGGPDLGFRESNRDDVGHLTAFRTPQRDDVVDTAGPGVPLFC